MTNAMTETLETIAKENTESDVAPVATQESVEAVKSHIANETQETPVSFESALAAYVALKRKKTADNKAATLAIGKAELKLVFYVLARVSDRNNADRLLQFVKDGKPSALAKRVLQGTIANASLAIRFEDKTLELKRDNSGERYELDSDKMHILERVVKSGDSINCDDIKQAFPEREKTGAESLNTIGKTLAKLLDSNKLTKGEIIAFVNEL